MVKTIKPNENRSSEQPKKNKSALPKKKSAREVLEEYKSGKREFHDLDLSGESFAECNLSGADFTNCNLKGTNFRKARLKKAIFHKVQAGSENSQIEYTLFFISLLVVTFATIFSIFLLVNSRQSELDVINKYGADFLSLAVLVPFGYVVHLFQSGTMIAHGFWAGGILVFWLKMFEQPLSGFFGDLLFLGMAFTLISPIYRLWRSRGKSSGYFLINFLLDWLWRNTTKPRCDFLVNLGNFLICVISGLLAIIPVVFSFVPLNLDLLEDGSFLLTLSAFAFSLPAIFSLLFSLATYSILFDSSKGETYAKIFNTFILILFPALAFLLYYFEIIVDFEEVFIQLEISSLVIFVLFIVILWLIFSLILRVKNYLKWLIWLIFPVLFWSYLRYISISVTDSDPVPKQITIFAILFLLSSSVLLASNFATLHFGSKRSTKLLGWWYFLGLALPLSVISMPTISVISMPTTISEDFSWLNWSLFFVPILSLWLLFLLSVSVPSIYYLVVRLMNKIKKRAICRFLPPLWLSTLIRAYLLSASFVIVFFLWDWLEYGYADGSHLSYLLEQFYSWQIAGLVILALVVVAVLSFFMWGVSLLAKSEIVKSKIAESKSQVLPDRKIKSKYSGFRNLAVFARCLGGTDFASANLTEANFSKAELAGVNFRGARLKRAIWSDAQGLEGAAVGNTYLKYPKVRNWVVRVKQVFG